MCSNPKRNRPIWRENIPCICPNFRANSSIKRQDRSPCKRRGLTPQNNPEDDGFDHPDKDRDSPCKLTMKMTRSITPHKTGTHPARLPWRRRGWLPRKRCKQIPRKRRGQLPCRKQGRTPCENTPKTTGCIPRSRWGSIAREDTIKQKRGHTS